MPRLKNAGNTKQRKKCVKPTAYPCGFSCIARYMPNGKERLCRNRLRGQAENASLWLKQVEERLTKINTYRSSKGKDTFALRNNVEIVRVPATRQSNSDRPMTEKRNRTTEDTIMATHIENFKSAAKTRLTKVNRLTGLTRINPKASVLALDVIDVFADVLFKEESEEEAKEYIADILACPIWDDPEEWEDALKLNLSPLQVGQKIEAWIESKDRWEKAAKAITSSATQSIQEQSDFVAEPDMEDALNTVEALPFKGSEKQIKWAKDIAIKNLRDVAIALKNNRQLPLSAKWWIDNRTGLNF